MKAVVVWLACCLIWGTTWFFIKIGLEDLPPLSFAAARFVLSVAIILAIIFPAKIGFPDLRKHWRVIVVPGLLTFGLNYALVFWGENQISSGLAAVLQATIPVFGLVFAQFMLPDEKITAQKLGGIVLGLIGVSVIFYEQLQVSGFWALAGCAALVLSAASAAFANVLVKSNGTTLHPLAIVAGQMVIGTVPLTVAALLAEGNPLQFRWTWTAIWSVLYLAIVGSVLAFWLYYWLLKRIEAVKAMLIALVTPLIAVVVGWLALGENLPGQTAFGGLLILLSVGLILFRSKKNLTAETQRRREKRKTENGELRTSP